MRRNEKGEAFLVMMGIMLAGGLVLWLATGSFHMMPAHGEKGMHQKDSSPSASGSRKGSPVALPGAEKEKDESERAVEQGAKRDDTEPVSADAHVIRIPDPLHWGAGSMEPDRMEGMPRGAGGINPVEKI